uniref:Uncharacterized protein n=1 Tax=Rhizophora mucronata TaxID=61149 RepID=A0A2P2JL16_RHIMU
MAAGRSFSTEKTSLSPSKTKAAVVAEEEEEEDGDEGAEHGSLERLLIGCFFVFLVPRLSFRVSGIGTVSGSLSLSCFLQQSCLDS